MFFAYTNPTYTGPVASLRGEIHSYDNALVAARAYREKEEALISERNAISAEGLARIEAFLPDGVDNVQLILDLNALAGRTGLTLSDFDIVETAQSQAQDPQRLSIESAGLTDSVELTVTAVGTYDAFKRFLDGVEWSLRPLDLVELSITDSQTGVYSYNMKFRIYWLSAP